MSLYIERNNMGGRVGNDPQQDQPHGDPHRGGSGQQAKSNQEQQRVPYSGGTGQTTPGMGGMTQGGMNQSGMNQSGMTQPGVSQGAPTNGQGGTDYRDDLRVLLDKAHAEKGLTRYRLCKQMGIDSGTLSNVLAKRRHFSLEKLEQILHLLGYRLSFMPDNTQAS